MLVVALVLLGLVPLLAGTLAIGLRRRVVQGSGSGCVSHPPDARPNPEGAPCPTPLQDRDPGDETDVLAGWPPLHQEGRWRRFEGPDEASIAEAVSRAVPPV